MAKKHIYSDPAQVSRKASAVTDDEMKREYEYYMANKMTKKLFDEGMITKEEYENIRREHARNFMPELAPLMP